MDPTAIYKVVQDRYSRTALAPSCPSYSRTVAEAFGYSTSDLATIPTEANLGVSCGNPLALANLQQGDTVIDLGSGAGFDCLLAARKVGDVGRVIGIDMNEDMLTKARQNASKAAIHNATFLSSRITSVNIPDATADVVISNCVINIVPQVEKHLVFQEMFRLLKPGGRLAVSDILTKKDLPEHMKHDVALYVGCIAGASRKEEYEAWLKEAGFRQVIVVDAGMDLNVYTQTSDEENVGASCCGSIKVEESKAAKQEGMRSSDTLCGSENSSTSVIEGMKANFDKVDLNEWAGSFKIFAIKET